MADRELRVIQGLLAALFTMGAAGVTAGVMSDKDAARLNAATTIAENGTEYRLLGAHAVTVRYEDRNYTFNFENQTVFADHSRHVGFGGAGAGGLMSFNQLNNPALIDITRAKGCVIARNKVPTLPSDSLFKGSEIREVKMKAEIFAARYCPQV